MDKSRSIKQKIDIQNNKEALDYYEYLRNITENQESAYWIGNPSVQIISGKILLEPLNPVQTDHEPENFEEYLEEIKKSNVIASSRRKQSIFSAKSGNEKEQEAIQRKQKTSISQTDPNQSNQKNNKIPSIKSSRCLLLSGIPNSKSPVEVLETPQISFLSHQIIQIRVIKTVHIKYYGMLLLLKDATTAISFFNELFGQPFNNLQMQRVILRQVKQISLSFSELNSKGNNEMMLLRELKGGDQFVKPQNIFMTYHHQKIKDKIKTAKQKELGDLVCAICFEECDKQAISILCGHYFDFDCLEKWSENICPLCRYHQQPPIIKFCERCNQCEGLWVCLICGQRLCCGVNNDILSQDSHIYEHFKLSGHSLSMQLETKFLFDAKIPAFLHQKFYQDLMKSQEEIQTQHYDQKQNNKKAKIHQQIQEYEGQVAEQMKSQRKFFQGQINHLNKTNRQILNKKRSQIDSLQSQISLMNKEQIQKNQSISSLQRKCLEKQKQLKITQSLIKSKAAKVSEVQKSFKNIEMLKQQKIKQLDAEIAQKRQQLYNYRKNMKLKNQLGEKLKNESVEGEFIIGGQIKGKSSGSGKDSKKNKGKNTVNK